MVRVTVELEDNSDHDLAARVQAFLTAQHVPSLRRLNVEARQGTITLRGRVRNFYEKQLFQQCRRRVAGVQQLIDQVVVQVRLS